MVPPVQLVLMAITESTVQLAHKEIREPTALTVPTAPTVLMVLQEPTALTVPTAPTVLMVLQEFKVQLALLVLKVCLVHKETQESKESKVLA
jgi:hypothetical protein